MTPNARRGFPLFALLFSLAAAASAVPAAACSAEDCFRGKTISLVVGYGAGGGYDAYARLIAPDLERLTGATVVVRNRPGAGGLIALNEMARAPGDGLTLGVVNVTAAVVAQGLGVEAVRFDIGKFSWLAGIGSEQRALVTAADASTLPWKSPKAASQPVRWAAGGQTDEMAINAALLSESLGLRARIVTGYKGSNEAVLGVVRGEADAVMISADSARQYADARAIKVAALVSSSRSPFFPDVPTIFEAAAGADLGGDWIRLLTGLSALGRGLAATPGTPDDLVAHLRTALGKILTDNEFLRRAKAAERNVDYQSPNDLAGAVASTLATVKRQPEFRHVVLEKYY
ncbi:MAG: tripartite tricarboxylate transporter substrate-binding protein [Xanthobacteraceae bacterium]